MSTATTPRSRLKPDKPDEVLDITSSRRRILELLHKHRYMTPRLLAFAYSRDEGRNGRGFSHVRHELTELWHHGYAARHYWASGPVGSGSPELIYTITPKGAREALEPAAYSRDRHLIYRRIKEQRANFEHHLALAELELVLSHGATEWRVVGFTSDERRLRLRLKRRGGTEYGLQPDAWVLVEFANGQRTLLLVEVDIGRKNNPRIDQRFEDYGMVLSSRLEDLKKRYGVNNAIALFVEPDAGEAARLRARAVGVLRQATYAPRPYFLFWNRDEWFVEEHHERRQRTAGSTWRVRDWTVRVLRDPAEILTSCLVTGLNGKARPLLRG